MELSKTERIILINQYEILKNLEEDHAEYYDKLIEILEYGYEYFYSEIDRLSSVISLDESKFIIDLLSFYRNLERYKRENPANEDIKKHYYAIFRGFDGNEEGGFYSFTKFVIEIDNLFAEQLQYSEETDGFNSHSRMIEKYRRIVEKWREFGGKYIDSSENLSAILDA